MQPSRRAGHRKDVLGDDRSDPATAGVSPCGTNPKRSRHDRHPRYGEHRHRDLLRDPPERSRPVRCRAAAGDPRPQLVFEGPIAGHRVGAEPFCKGVVGFVSALQHLEMRQLVTTPGKAAALYDAELPGGTCRFAEFFELDTEVITGLRLLFDPKRYIEVGGH